MSREIVDLDKIDSAVDAARSQLFERPDAVFGEAIIWLAQARHEITDLRARLHQIAAMAAKAHGR